MRLLIIFLLGMMISTTGVSAQEAAAPDSENEASNNLDISLSQLRFVAMFCSDGRMFHTLVPLAQLNAMIQSTIRYYSIPKHSPCGSLAIHIVVYEFDKPNLVWKFKPELEPEKKPEEETVTKPPPSKVI